jgi:hypothetical protein
MKKEEFNICEFHDKLKTSLISSLSSEEDLLERKNDIEDKLVGDLSYREYTDYKYTLLQINNKLALSQSCQFFFHSVSPIVEEFRQLLNQTVKYSFVRKQKFTRSVCLEQKLILVDRYVHELERYPELSHHIPVFSQDSDNDICEDCKSPLSEVDSSNLVCEKCGREYPYFYKDFSVSGGEVCFKDLSRINTNVKYSYIREIHFKDTIKQFQGKQNKYIDPGVYNILCKSFENANLGEKNAQGKYIHIKKDHIKMFLQENGLYKYYEDINLIHYKLTDIPCPNIFDYEKVLIDDFRKLVNAYDVVIKNDNKYNRSNFLGSYYILYQLLLRHGYQCKESDFPLIKTIERRIEYDDIYNECCQQLGWYFTPTV